MHRCKKNTKIRVAEDGFIRHTLREEREYFSYSTIVVHSPNAPTIACSITISLLGKFVGAIAVTWDLDSGATQWSSI